MLRQRLAPRYLRSGDFPCPSALPRPSQPVTGQPKLLKTLRVALCPTQVFPRHAKGRVCPAQELQSRSPVRQKHSFLLGYPGMIFARCSPPLGPSKAKSPAAPWTPGGTLGVANLTTPAAAFRWSTRYGAKIRRSNLQGNHGVCALP